MSRLSGTLRNLLGTCLVLIALLGCATSNSTTESELAALAKGLSWDSVGGNDVGYDTVYVIGIAAERLLAIGDPATEALLRVLEDPTRGVAAHLILTNLYHPERIAPTRRWIFVQPRRYFNNDADLRGVALTVNGLEWEILFNPAKKRRSDAALSNLPALARRTPQVSRPSGLKRRGIRIVVNKTSIHRPKPGTGVPDGMVRFTQALVEDEQLRKWFIGLQPLSMRCLSE